MQTTSADDIFRCIIFLGALSVISFQRVHHFFSFANILVQLISKYSVVRYLKLSFPLRNYILALDVRISFPYSKEYDDIRL